MFKTSMLKTTKHCYKKLQKIQRKGKHMWCSWVRRLPIVKISILLSYWFSAHLQIQCNLNENLNRTFYKNWQGNSKIHMEMKMTCTSQNNLEKEQSWRANVIWFQDWLQIYSNHDGLVFAQDRQRDQYNRIRVQKSIQIYRKTIFFFFLQRWRDNSVMNKQLTTNNSELDIHIQKHTKKTSVQAFYPIQKLTHPNLRSKSNT